MKKALSILLALVMVVSMSVTVFANGNGDYTVRINGNGNNARIQVLYNRTVVHTSVARPANNAWYQVTLESGTVVAVFVSGNSVNRFNVTAAEAPDTPDGDDIGVSTPNHSSGGEGVQRIGNVEIRGNGGSARIWINNQNTGVSPNNNTYTTVEFAGYTIEVFVRGNAILRWGFVEGNVAPYTPYVPTVVERSYFREYVRTDKVASRLDARVESECSNRTLGFNVDHDAHQYHMGQSSDPRTSGVTGQGARITALTATLTLNFSYQFRYVEQFQRFYQYVDVTVWSNGERDEVVRANSVHAFGSLVDGKTYYTLPAAGSNVFSVAYNGSILLHMGNQGLSHQREFAYANDLFDVSVELTNTGNPPTVVVTHSAVINDLPLW